ncbi:hypothetical protein Tco_1315047 [Tanacetum coccineum]
MSNDPISQEIGFRSERESKHSYDSPLPGVNTPRSDEKRNEQQDLTDFVPPTPHDSPLSGGHTPGSDEVKRLEKALRARTPGMKLFKIGTSRRKGLDKENVSKQWRKSDKIKPMHKDIDFDVLDDAMENIKDDEMTTIVDTLMAIRSARPRITSVMIRNIEEEPMRATLFEREQRIARERATKQEAKDAALIEQMEGVKERMDADELLAARLQEQEREHIFC